MHKVQKTQFFEEKVELAFASSARFALALAALWCADAVAMPTEEELQKVKPILKTLTEDDYAAVKAGTKTRSELADSLLGYVGDAESEAAKFSLIQAAFKNYMEVYEPEKAIIAFDSLDANVKDVPRGAFGDWCSPHVAKFAKNGRADALAVLLNKSLDSDDSKSTSALMTALKPYMRKLGAGAKAPATPFAAAVERATRQERRARELATLKAAVKKTPSDASAHEKYALALAASGDWGAALKEFALASGPVAEAAAWEAKWPNAGESSWTPAKAAELWWDRADAAKDEDAASVLRGRSVAWYRIAIDKGELTGLRKTIAEKRIKEADESGAVAATIAAAPAPVVERNDPPPSRRSRRGVDTFAAPAPVADIAPVKIKGGPWTLPKAFATPLERSLDLGGGVQMPFCAIPAGSFRMMDHKVVITRPFWMSKTVASLNQLMACPEWNSFDRLRSSNVEKCARQFKDKFATAPLRRQDICYYTDWLTKTFKSILPSGYVIRMPTEAEFFYAYGAGADEDRVQVNVCCDDASLTGEALAGLGWIERSATWDVFKTIPSGYRWLRLMSLPNANSFGVFPLVPRQTQQMLLDRVDTVAKDNFISMRRDQFKSLMGYEAEEVDPLHFGAASIITSGRIPCDRFAAVNWAGHAGNFMVVIGPDLESEKKAAGK